jgi:hypothetical protein
MSENISGFGLKVVVVASTTFPAGLELSQWADDTDPFDLPELTIADTGMGVNGDMVVWAKPTPIEIKLAVVPNGVDDTNLALLFEANRVAKGKRGARDIITLTGVYPDGKIKIFQQGVTISGVPGNSIQSAGRYKTKTYGFRFENQAGTN